VIPSNRARLEPGAKHPIYLADAFLAPLRFIGGGLGLDRAFRWLQEERLRIAAIRELDRLNDDYLDDIGIKRKDIRPIVSAMVKRIRDRRCDPSFT
jgi:uncharacterized protein YjiS (DUF1127 family)